MPFILFIFSVTLILIFQKQARKFLHYFALLFLIIFFSIFNLNDEFKRGVGNFYGQISKMAVLIIEKDFNSENSPAYLKEFSEFIFSYHIFSKLKGVLRGYKYKLLLNLLSIKFK